MATYPQVLLLGNGINISNGGETWKEFLKSLADNANDVTIDSTLPMPLQAILISKNNLREKLKDKAKKLLPVLALKDNVIPLADLLDIGFDEIITTNYTYELEQACLNKKPIREKKLCDMHVNVNGGKADPKYLLQTCNILDYCDTEQHIWHIHGEARKPNSMVLGHYYYGKLINRIINYIEKRKNSYAWYQSRNEEVKIKSWIDAFIMGDVYVLGQGFDTSEIDLWWLLNRKLNEKAQHGKVYFFEPFKESQKEKIALLKCFDVKIENFGISEIRLGDKDCTDYVTFYKKAIQKISKLTKRR